MTHSTRQLGWPVSLLVISLAGAAPAAAQSRFEISANVGVQAGASTFTTSTTLPSNGGENATLTVDHSVKTTPGFSAGGAVRLLRDVWVGAQYGMAGRKPRASVTAVIPHPILFNAPRTVEGSVNDVRHDEQTVHVDLIYALPVRALDVKVMGGPTFFKLKQQFVSAVAISETYPFDSATFASATTKQSSETAVGFNAGVDISRPLSSRLGVGALIRYSRADVTFDDREIGEQTVKGGGLEVGGGVRVRF